MPLLLRSTALGSHALELGITAFAQVFRAISDSHLKNDLKFKGIQSTCQDREKSNGIGVSRANSGSTLDWRKKKSKGNPVKGRSPKIPEMVPSIPPSFPTFLTGLSFVSFLPISLFCAFVIKEKASREKGRRLFENSRSQRKYFNFKGFHAIKPTGK